MRQVRIAMKIAAMCWLLLGLAAASPQGAKNVRAKLGSGVVKLGDVGEILLEVTDSMNVQILEVPDVDGIEFAAPSGPSQHRSRSFVNGRVTSSTRLKYVIRFRPTREGEFTLGPVRLSVDGQEVRTHSMGLTVVKDLDGARFGFLEFVDLPERVYDGEVFTIALRFGWDDQLKKINSADLRLPWWGNLSGVLEVPSSNRAVGGTPTRVNLNSEEQIDVIEVPRTNVNGKPHRTFVLKRQFIATRSGALEIPKSFLVYAVVESNGIFNSRQQTRQRYFVGAEPRTIEVLALPDEGRPLEYSNAVGSFNVRAVTDRWDVDAGDSIKLTVEWLGRGNLEFFERPDLARLDAFEGFRAYGVSRDDFLGDRRVVIYDIAPLRPDIREIPGVPLSVFDTVTGEYTTITSDPIAIRVRALEGATPLGELGEAGREYDIIDIKPLRGTPEPEARVGTRNVTLLLLLSPLLALGMRILVRKQGDPNSREMVRKRKAKRILVRALARCDKASEQARAFYAFLGSRSGEGEAAWVGRDVEASREQYSLAEEPARSLAELLARLDESTYARNDSALPREELVSVANSLIRGGL